MKPPTRLFPLLALLLLAAAAPSLASADENVTVRGILVAASRESGDSDRRLAAYESTLRRILRFESFQQVGAGRGRSALPGTGTFSVGAGHQLNYRATSADGNRLRVEFVWTHGKRNLMRTQLVLRPGVPAVLGGPSQSDGSVLALIVVAQ